MSVIINGSAGVTTNSGAVYDGIQRGTAITLTNQTAPEFTSIPSWVKRIMVILNGVSQSSATPFGIVQVGSGSYTTSGYVATFCTAVNAASTTVSAARTDGFVWGNLNNLADTVSGHMILTLISGNNWIASGTFGNSNSARVLTLGGNISLGGTLDRVRITTTDGTTTFDAGTINILFE